MLRGLENKTSDESFKEKNFLSLAKRKPRNDRNCPANLRSLAD